MRRWDSSSKACNSGGPRSTATIATRSSWRARCKRRDDRLDVQARHVEAGKARALFIEHHGEVGAGEQDGLDARAALQVCGDAAQAIGVVGRAAPVEDALVGLADERDLV